MFARLSELASQFTKTVDALQRERDGKATSRFQFSSPPPPARKRLIRLSPPQFAPDLVSATQLEYDDDVERDSLALHSYHTQLKRLIEPWQIISSSRSQVIPRKKRSRHSPKLLWMISRKLVHAKMYVHQWKILEASSAHMSVGFFVCFQLM
jgi:hypothetical protein